MGTDTTLDLGTEVLESLDFPIQCDHSAHSTSPHHSGVAEFTAQVTHDCPVRPQLFGSVYACCATWAGLVTSHQDLPWRCPHCRTVTDGRDMVIIVGTLHTD